MSKPGMHQIVTNDSEFSELPIDLEDLVKKMTGIQPVYSMPHGRGIGRKAYIQADSKKDRIVIEFFSELVANDCPTDPVLGYSEDDVTKFRGVMIARYEEDKDAEGYHKNQGEIIPYEEFVEKYVHDTMIRIQLERIMDDMDSGAEVNERFLESANTYWENREPGSKTIPKIELH